MTKLNIPTEVTVEAKYRIGETALHRLKMLTEQILEGRQTYNPNQVQYLRMVVSSMQEQAKEMRKILDLVK